MPATSIQLLSDLHLEMDRGCGLDYETFHIQPKADILALLGDIGNIHEQRLFTFLRQQTMQFKKVLYVLGNHEFYHMSHDDAINNVHAFAAELNHGRAKDPSIGEFIVLDRKRVDLSPTLTILGATLWSQLNPDDLDILRWGVTDFSAIHGFTPERYVELHNTDLAWFNAEVERIRVHDPDRQVVVFTHHAPAMHGTADPKYAGGPSESAFATDLVGQKCWGDPVKVWVFGHTHWSCDFVKDGIRVVSNQRGYSKGDASWDPEFVLQLSS